MSDEKNHRYWLDLKCHDCGRSVGQLHKLGCDMERCPLCGGQLISCDEKHYQWVEQGRCKRIPYIQPLVNCAVCGIIFPEFFKVTDEEWLKHVIPPLQSEVLCEDCYNAMKELFPEGWAALEQKLEYWTVEDMRVTDE